MGGEIKFDEKEVLDVQWKSFEELEAMTDKELRAFAFTREIIRAVKANDVYPLGIVKDIGDLGKKLGREKQCLR